MNDQFFSLFDRIGAFDSPSKRTAPNSVFEDPFFSSFGNRVAFPHSRLSIADDFFFNSPRTYHPYPRSIVQRQRQQTIEEDSDDSSEEEDRQQEAIRSQRRLAEQRDTPKKNLIAPSLPPMSRVDGSRSSPYFMSPSQSRENKNGVSNPKSETVSMSDPELPLHKYTQIIEPPSELALEQAKRESKVNDSGILDESLSDLDEETRRWIEEESKAVSNEKIRMQDRFKLYGLEEREITGDGNCQFAAVSDQLFKKPDYHPWIRKKVVDWLKVNSQFKIDNQAKLSDFLNRDLYPSWDDYINCVKKDGTWGDHITLVAMANLFEVSIVIISSVQTPGNSDGVIFIDPTAAKKKKNARVLTLSHWHERHYGSLGPAGQR